MRRKRAGQVDTSIDGNRIRIPGYMLPLKRDDSGVTEFLLVPWVGACIHTPPPPPNQMVHVDVPGGTEDLGRFAAIWLEGRIELEPREYELFLVDGSRKINVAYTMVTESITPYSSGDSDTLAKVQAPPPIRIIRGGKTCRQKSRSSSPNLRDTLQRKPERRSTSCKSGRSLRMIWAPTN